MELITQQLKISGERIYSYRIIELDEGSHGRIVGREQGYLDDTVVGRKKGQLRRNSAIGVVQYVDEQMRADAAAASS